MQNKYYTNMNQSEKDLLRNVLIAGEINVETFDKIKKDIFKECHLDTTQSKDRALWSMWINAKSVPNRFCQVAINKVLKQYLIEPIYDQVTND